MLRWLPLLVALFLVAGCREGAPNNPRPSTLDQGKADGPKDGKGAAPVADAKSPAKQVETKSFIERIGGQYGLIQISKSLHDRVAKNPKLKNRAKEFGDFIAWSDGLAEIAKGEPGRYGQAVAGSMDAEVQPEFKASLDEHVPAEVRDEMLKKIEALRKK
ncbi:MAG: hypothetical protein K2X38_22270 [Gemmataceae bacterium]|nr:hypothetical protein [Gemmataceae bacterium]